MARRKVVRRSNATKEIQDADREFSSSLVSSIQKACGGDSAVSLDNFEDTITSKPVSWVPTGLRWLDLVMSEGRGLPCGKVIEIYGAEATGKTALCQYLIKQYQKKGGTAVYIDFETAIDTEHLKSYQLDLGSLIYTNVETVEAGFDAVMAVIKNLEARAKKNPEEKKPVLIVWDSIAMSTPAAEISESSHGDSHVGLLARAMSKGMRKLRRRIAKVNCTLLFTNQIRDKIGVMFGEKTAPPGGRAVRFTASIRIKTTRIKTLNVTKNKRKIPAGYIIECNVQKTRFAAPHQKGQFVLSFRCGVDPSQSLINYLVDLEILRKTGKSMKFVPDDITFKTKEWKEFYRDNKKAVNQAVKEAESKIVSNSTEDDDDESSTDE